MRTREQIRIDYYGTNDSRAYDNDELNLMKEFANECLESYIEYKIALSMTPKEFIDKYMIVSKIEDNEKIEPRSRIEEEELWKEINRINKGIYIVEPQRKYNPPIKDEE